VCVCVGLFSSGDRCYCENHQEDFLWVLVVHNDTDMGVGDDDETNNGRREHDLQTKKLTNYNNKQTNKVEVETPDEKRLSMI
jgi:hypothetical protein